MLYIFDLDHTLIDSSHRQLTKPDGSLDLDHWIENCTREKILADRILPLGKIVQGFLRESSPYARIACTARVMSEPDYEFLKINGFDFETILSRPADNKDSDVILKDKLLRKYATERGMSFARLMKTAHFWDDNESIRNHFTAHGVACYNPISFNKGRML